MIGLKTNRALSCAGQRPGQTFSQALARALLVLESELPGQLDNAIVERAVDLTEVGIVDIQRVRNREVRMIENVERLEPEFQTESLFETRPLD